MYNLTKQKALYPVIKRQPYIYKVNQC